MTIRNLLGKEDLFREPVLELLKTQQWTTTKGPTQRPHDRYSAGKRSYNRSPLPRRICERCKDVIWGDTSQSNFGSALRGKLRTLCAFGVGSLLVCGLGATGKRVPGNKQQQKGSSPQGGGRG